MSDEFSIIIVDDEPTNIELATVYLKEEGYNVFGASKADEAMQIITKESIDLILLDIGMPDIDGFEFCKLLKKDNNTKEIPIIFLTAKSDAEYITKAFEVGGADYIIKPFNHIELKARVKTQLKNLSYLKEIRIKQAKFAQISITDPLTKLNNYLYFDSKIKEYQDKKEPFWFIYISLNRFYKFNNFYGFHKSNQILRAFSKILQEATPSNAIVARLYGVGFGILIRNYDEKVIKSIFNTINSKMSKEKIISGIDFSMVFYNIRDKKFKETIPDMYKTIQKAMRSENKYTIIE